MKLPLFIVILFLIGSLFYYSTSQKKYTGAVINEQKEISMSVTFYGWPDNDPPGNAIAYPKSEGNKTIHNKAGGDGTYDDPITMATDPLEIPIGTRVYLPFLKKYAVMEDLCEGCVKDWQRREYHIDIWLESDSNYRKEVVVCEEILTQEKTIVEIHPPRNRIVDKRLFFNPKIGKCLES